MSTKPLPALSFGSYVRAARMRFHPLPGNRKGYLRMSEAAGGFMAELRPLGLIPNCKDKGNTGYFLWWVNDGGRELIEESPFLRSITVVKEPFSVRLDEEGRCVG